MFLLLVTGTLVTTKEDHEFTTEQEYLSHFRVYNSDRSSFLAWRSDQCH